MVRLNNNVVIVFARIAVFVCSCTRSHLEGDSGIRSSVPTKLKDFGSGNFGGHGITPCVQCLSLQEAIVGPGFAPGLPL